MGDLRETNPTLIIISVFILLISVQPISAVTITSDVVLDPTGTPCKFNWQHTYEDNGTLIVEKDYIKVGGIRCECEPSSALTVMVNDWNPENKDEGGEDLFSLSTVAHTDGEFGMAFSNLPEGEKYFIFKEGEPGVWMNVTTDEDGVLEFGDEYHSQNDYVIQKAGEEIVPPTFPSPEEEGLISPPIIFIGVSIIIVVAAILILTRGD